MLVGIVMFVVLLITNFEPEALVVLNMPGMYLLAAIFGGNEGGLVFVPVVVIAQWTLAGTLIGIILHFIYGKKHSA